jgi:hypothetical protein
VANHCYNFVTFSGNEPGLKQLVSSLEKARIAFMETERELSENNVWIYGLNAYMILGTRPPSKDESGNYNMDVYQDYGSKWFDCNWEVTEVEGKLESVTLQGDSAWSPMLPLFEKIAKKMKLDGDGNYEESGMDFAGEFEVSADGLCSHREMTYREYLAENNPNCFWEDRLNDIEEGWYESLEAVYEDFQEVQWELSDKEKTDLEEAFREYEKHRPPQTN